MYKAEISCRKLRYSLIGQIWKGGLSDSNAPPSKVKVKDLVAELINSNALFYL